MQNSFLQWFASKFLDRTLSPRELLTVRKWLYGALILLLFTGSFFWRRYAVEAQENELKLREESRGDLELSGSVLRLSLTGFRGLATCILWNNAIETQKKNQWSELEFQVRWLTKLQPHFIVPWLFQSWNLSYNVSVESDRISDKYFFITRGILLLTEGERQNRDNPDMRFSIGFYTQHKITISDETNVHRSLFQLSCIPPNQRDPARFWNPPEQPGGVRTFNWVEFEKFCKEHPKLVRRLREGLRRDDRQQQERLFTCEKPEDVVQFLAENWRVPSLYQYVAATPTNGTWRPDREDQLLPMEERFPALPPPRSPLPPQRLFLPTDSWKELTSADDLKDDVDGFAVARAWYCYAQEPIPDPDLFPGSTKDPTDRARQRRPRHMTTLLFRGYPALTEYHRSDALQVEGWFDGTPWKILGWFKGPQGQLDYFSDGKPAELAVPLKSSSTQAWADCRDMYKKHGEANWMLFPTEQDKVNKLVPAEKYWDMKGLPHGTRPYAPSNIDTRMSPREQERQTREQLESFIRSLPADEQPLYKAARFMYDYDFYRRLANFQSHYQRAIVEAEPETIAARKKLYEAETYRLRGSPGRALDAYKEGIAAWRDQVLSVKQPDKHREYREDNFIQESTFEIQLKYLDLVNEQYGRRLKQELTETLALIQEAGQLQRVAGGCVIADLLPLKNVLKYRLGSSGVKGVDVRPPGTLSLFKGPFDIEVMDPHLSAEQAAWAVGLLAFPEANGPLRSASAIRVFQTRPLIAPNVIQTVLTRKNLLPRPQAKDKEEKPRPTRPPRQ